MKINKSWVKEFFNCCEANIDSAGDVWIADPQAGHWLRPDEKEKLIAWVAEKKQHGGSRPGAGRPRVAEKRKPRAIRLTDEEYKKVNEYANKLKEGNNNEKPS